MSENFNQAEDSAVEATVNPQTATPQNNQPTTQELIDLASVQKFKIDGKEMTFDQLKKSMMLNSDYTKKTQSVAEVQKYWKNLDIDLENVKSNPSLAAQFMQVYPKEFHKFLKTAGIREEVQEAKQSGDPVLLEKVERLEKYLHNNEVKSKEAELDSIFSKNLTKYPEAIEDVVMAKAQVLLEQGQEPTQEFWDRLFKSNHEAMLKRMTERQQKVLTAQRASNEKGRSTGAGGGTPGQAPKRLTMKDAGEAMIADLKRK